MKSIAKDINDTSKDYYISQSLEIGLSGISKRFFKVAAFTEEMKTGLEKTSNFTGGDKLDN